MTVGEKIQLYRKKIGLSQEELGRKLLVSRQTVSLWEMDKTLPTIDNLLLLKEIFSVSVDDILGAKASEEEKARAPKESYTFQYAPSELEALFKKVSAPLVKHILVLSVLCVLLCLIPALLDKPNVLHGIVIGCNLLLVLLGIRSYFASKKVWKDRQNRITDSAYTYHVFENHFVINISRNNESVRTQKVCFEDVERKQIYGNFLFLQISGQYFILRQDALLPDSVFITGRIAPGNMTVRNKTAGILKIVSLLFVLSLCILLNILLGFIMFSGIEPSALKSSWLLYLCLPIPVASAAFGFYLKQKGYRYKLLVILGLCTAVLLCIFGSFSF